MGYQYNDCRIYTGKGLAGAFFVAANQFVAGFLQAIRLAANPAENMPVLPVMQRFGISEHTCMFCVHVYRGTAQVQKAGLRSRLQYFIPLVIIDGNGEKIAFSVCSQQGRRLDGVH